MQEETKLKLNLSVNTNLNGDNLWLDDVILDVFSDLRNKLEITDLSFLLHAFMIGGFVYNFASYDLDEYTNHFFEAKHKNN